MSTRATIAHGTDFHFYHEVHDDNHVYLELENVDFEASRDKLLVAIPIHIWEVIRHRGAAQLDLLHTSDEELRQLVEREVTERISTYERAKRDSPREPVANFIGAAAFGMADTPREAQLVRGLEYYTRERERQREVWARMKEHKVVPARTLLAIKLTEPDEDQP